VGTHGVSHQGSFFISELDDDPVGATSKAALEEVPALDSVFMENLRCRLIEDPFDKMRLDSRVSGAVFAKVSFSGSRETDDESHPGSK
jgi:hypothetical protein